MTRLWLAAATLALSLSSTAWADLRTFDIDPRYQQEVFAALTDVLTPDPQRGLVMEAHGRVELLPSGQILVNASPQTLQQVEQVLQALRARPAAAAPRAALRYWAVLGIRTQPANAASAPGTPPPAALTDVLSELRRLHGELAFRVIGTAAITTESGQDGEVIGQTLTVNQTAYVQGDTLNADIEMTLQGQAVPLQQGNGNVVVVPPAFGIGSDLIGNLSLRTTLDPGEFVVLGESQVQGRGLDGPVFYIVRWEQ